jgi:2-methylisocitrate lyase-like PEP mutase family enzyme
MSNFQLFKDLHHQKEPLLLGNAWDVASARVLQDNGIKAIGTSSWAIADTLGYEDGEHISFSELFFVAERIARHVKVPLSVDMERGYSGDPAEVVKHIEQLHDIGVVGINLEDSVVADGRALAPVDEFRRKLEFIRNQLSKKNMAVFINARTDTFLLNVPDRLNETFTRIKAYEAAGADGIFVPFIRELSDIKQVTGATALPVNVLSMPDLPSFAALQEAGVRRISMGGSVYKSVISHLKKAIYEISSNGSFTSVF